MGPVSPPRRSIRGKLLRLVILAVASSVMLLATSQLWLEANRYLVAKRSVMEATAAAFAAASAPAVAQHNVRGVAASLRGIGSLRNIEFVTVTDGRGAVLASLGSGVRLAGDLDLDPKANISPLRLLETRTVSFTVPIRDSGQRIGSLTIIEDVADLWPRLRNVLFINFSVGMAALALAGLVVFRLQAAITKPLLLLTRAIERMGRDGVGTRVEGIAADDEVGVLTNRFNAMVEAIRERDERLIAHRDNLEREVAERTHDLALARDEAVGANRAKSTFLATMSHEIRTPMTGLLVMAELLASGELPPGARRYAEVICRSGSALLAIINDILDFSKIEAGKLEVERIRVDVRDVIQTVLNLFYARALEKGLDLAAYVAAEVPAVIEGDPVRLQQIVSNLVNNALKFTSAGHVLVRADYRGGSLIVSVRDTGIGISEAQRARIFDAFAQADETTTRQFGGTGLGLAISHRLARAMDGEIVVESTPGAGSDFQLRVRAKMLEPRPPSDLGLELSYALSISRPATALVLRWMLDDLRLHRDEGDSADITFSDHTLDRIAGRLVRLADPGTKVSRGPWLKLPLAFDDLTGLLEDLVSGTERPEAKSLISSTLPAFANAKVLVADDTAVNREVMVEALKRFAIVPDLVCNGHEAVRAAATTFYDLIFMDGSMPELDGFEATRTIRSSDGPCKATRIIALTAHVVGAAADLWRQAGMDDVLYKPFMLADLQRALEAVLTEAHPGQPGIDAARVHTPQESFAEPLIDRSVLADIFSVGDQTGSDFANRIFQLFLREAPQALEGLRAAQRTKDAKGVGSAAHAIKSMSYNVGASRVAECALRVERGARDGAVEATIIGELETALQATCTLLADEVLGSGTPSTMERGGPRNLAQRGNGR